MRKLFLNTILPILLIGGLTIFGITVDNVYYGNLGKNSVYADSLEDNPPPSATGPDVSGMFNERGYYKSNSVSVDENELISDLNGNLMYTFPMFNMKGPGDIFIDLNLTYNGSMNYFSFTNDSTFNGSNPSKYNFNAPGWVFSLNGVGVQMTNFETDFFTKKDNPSVTEIEEDDVHLLASGYHISDKLEGSSGADPDKLMIMNGDGSVLTLKRFAPSSPQNPDDYYIGEYYSENRGDYTRAIVKFIEDGSFPYYRNREVHLMKGDGLTYIFQESKNEYADLGYEYYGSYFLKPQVLLLKEIVDRFGHKVTLNYITHTGSQKIYGRPLLQSITTSWPYSNINFTYVTVPSGAVVVSGAGNSFKVKTDGFLFLPGEHPHKGFVTQLVNNNDNNTVNITSESYIRTGTDLIYNSTPSNLVDVVAELKRIKKVVNYNGGVRWYEYVGTPDETADMSPPNQKKIMVDGGSSTLNTKFFGQGRDIFFNNMVSKKTTMMNATDTIKVDQYDYKLSTTRAYDSGEYPWSLYPVHYDDDYYSVVETTPGSAGIQNESPGKFGTQRKYKNFVVGLTQIGENNPDFEGHTKILRELYYNTDTSNFYKKVDYYAVHSHASSFLDTLVVETLDGVERSVRSQYEHSQYPFQSETYLNPITKKTSLDPLMQKNESYLHIFLDTSIHYPRGEYLPGQSQNFDTTFFYLLNQPDSVKVFSPEGNLIHKETNQFILTNGVLNPGVSDSGYIGQVKSNKVFAGPSFTSYKENKYKYYMNDTLGSYQFQFKPSPEGNLKKIIDPKGNETEFYYHLVGGMPGVEGSVLESGQEPKTRAYLLTESGSVDSTDLLHFTDLRMPTVTVSNPNSQVNLFAFKKYDPEGKVLLEYANNRLMTSYSYDGMDRIENVILPHDFGSGGIVNDTIIDTTFTQVQFTAIGDKWGYKDFLNPELFVLDVDPISFITVVDYSNEESTPNLKLPIVKLRQEFVDSLAGMDSIYSAQLIFHPPFLSGSVSDPNFKFGFIPIRNIQESGGTINFSQGSVFDIPFSAPTGANCTTIQNSYEQGEFFNTADVTESVRGFLSVNDDLQGFMFKPYVSGNPISYNFQSNFGICVDGYPVGIPGNIWKHHYSPRLIINGSHMKIDTTITPIYSGSSLQYIYHDAGDSIEILSKLSTGRSKKTKHFFDGFYRVKKSKIFTDVSANKFDSSQVSFNYMDAQANTIDGRNNKIELSYDKWMNVKKVLNADSSFTLDTMTYQNNLTNHFGTVSGLVSKQVFTDEEGNKFEKFSDAVGNLRREVKFVDMGTPSSPLIDSLITDYRYDSLYRVTNVKTPSNKIISYKYDGFGRQIERTTVDAGTEQFRHDINDNLRFSMDANQSSVDDFTFMGYDGINRPLYIGLSNLQFSGSRTDFATMNPDTSYVFENFGTNPDNFLTINVYDTLSTSIASGLFTPPSNYYSTANLTMGNLVATAYKTRTTDPWNYKYYRYDARGRVTKMWHVIDGLGTKVIDYEYNSSNTVAYMTYQFGDSDYKRFRYDYDDAGRLLDIKLYYPQEPHGDTSDALGVYKSFAGYTYNQNSQIDSIKMNEGGYLAHNVYNNRNWLYQIVDDNSEDIFNEVLQYFDNGNVSYQLLAGTYDDNMGSSGNLIVNYTYDKSNRLLNADADIGSKDMYDIENTYDKAGNILTMKRDDSNGDLMDNFAYTYYSGTNRLAKVTGSTNQFTYDANGNVTSEILSSGIGDMKYDYRNLLIEYKIAVVENYDDIVYLYYDEAGNRIRKKVVRVFNQGGSEEGGDNPPTTVSDKYYVRDVSGQELAIYDGSSLEQWNVAGNGKIESGGSRYFHVKDHLGTIRATLDTANTVVDARDVDMWGHRMPSREYISGINNEYIFTGKERDEDTGLDYFGARYYDSRIGRWYGVDPLMNEHYDVNPYNYVLCNPLKLTDPDGKDPILIFYPDWKIVGTQGVFGHAGILLVDNKTGETRYYDLTLKDGTLTKAEIRKSVGGEDISKVKVSNGEIDETSLRETIRDIIDDKGEGTGATYAEYIHLKSDEYQSMVDAAEEWLKDPGGYNSFAIGMGANCLEFMVEIAQEDEKLGVPNINQFTWYPNAYMFLNYYDKTKVVSKRPNYETDF
jgi:RHS repeat-associated protein